MSDADRATRYADRLSGRVIIVTGGNKGIGRAIALRLASEGATVVATGRDEQAGQETVRAFESAAGSRPGALRFLAADNADPSDIERVVSTTVRDYGAVHGLVNNAATMRRETIRTTSFDFMSQVLRINLVGAVEYTRLVLEQMIAQGGGAIVNIGSTHAWSGLADLFPYSISKGGLLTLTHHVARNYASFGVRCNWVTVGWVLTPGEIEVWERQGKSAEWVEQKGREVVPLGRLQQPEETAAAVAFLLSDEASQITDTELDVAGGLRV